jgi:WD40 repeat protein
VSGTIASTPKRIGDKDHVEQFKQTEFRPADYCLDFDNGGRVVWGLEDGIVKVCDPSEGKAHNLLQTDAPITALASLPDGRLAVGSTDGAVHICDMTTGGSSVVVRLDGPIATLAVLPDGRVVSGSEDRTVCIWDPQTGNAMSSCNTRIGSGIWRC